MTREVTGYWCEDCERAFYVAEGDEEPTWCPWCGCNDLAVEIEEE